MNFKEVFINTIFFLISFIFLFFIAEIGFRYYTDKKLLYDIEMHKYAKKLKYRSSIPGLSHEHIPNSQANLMGVDVKINSLGFRDEELTNPKPLNEKRILVLGQSITFGWGVPKDSIFLERVEHALNNKNEVHYSFINSGIGNYNTELENILFRKNLPIVKPDMVILHCFLRDAELIPSQSQNLLIANSYLVAYIYIKIKQAFFFNGQKYKSIGEYYLNMYQQGSEGWIREQTALLAIKKKCEDNNIPFKILIQPDLNEIGVNSPQEKCYKLIREFLQSNNFTFIDMSPIFREKVKDLHTIWVSKEDSHPNSVGHKIIAEELIKVFNNN
jgi:hypothetical protein